MGNKAWSAADIPDQSGRVAIVTGANSGIGYHTALELARKGAEVILAVRSVGKGEAAAADICQGEIAGSVEVMALDLADLSSVAAFADAFRARYERLDLLINNAGVMMCPEGKTADGFETQFGTNHLGHFAFTAGLMPALAPGARVVTLSSGAHLRGTCDLEDLNWERRDYDPNLAYAQSKTANIWFASELQRRYGDRLLSLSVHPGVIQTDLARHLPEAVVEGMREGFEKAGVAVKNVPQGAATSVWAATAAELSEHGGAYLLDCHVAPPISEEVPRQGYEKWAYDEASAKGLWAKSEALTGVSFP